MKNSILKSTLLLFTLITLSSCSNNNDDSNIPSPQPITEDTWKLNDFNFSRSTSFQNSTTYTNGNPFTQVNVDSNISSNNGDFKTCNIVFWFNTSTEGTYTAKSINTLASFTTLKYMNIKCIVSNAAGAGAVYESIDSDVVVTVTKINNKFVMTANAPITLNKTLNDGLPNAPVTINFTCDKVK